MSKEFDVQGLQELLSIRRESYEPTVEVQSEVVAETVEVASEAQKRAEQGDTNSHRTRTEFTSRGEKEVWIPENPQYCKAIAEYYGVTTRSIQSWYNKIVAAFPFLEGLRLSDDRYSVECVSLMGEYKVSGLKFEVWADAKLKELEHQPRYIKENPATPSFPQGETYLQSALTPTSGYMGLVGAFQAMHQQMSNEELALLAEIDGDIQTLELNQTQYEQADDLEEAWLMRQAALEGARLGVKYEKTKNESFRSTRFKVSQRTRLGKHQEGEGSSSSSSPAA
jgi:hypothetical protein